MSTASRPRPRPWTALRLPVWAGLTLLFAAALALRSLRLAWQPLWWDEGYSVFFATELLGRMALLTAQDIHPPLYYGLLHGWTLLWGSADPVILRALSVLIGSVTMPVIWWVGRLLFPARPRVALVAALLLAVNPMHIFYSQEVRMYGLELLLGLLSTGFFIKLRQADTPSTRRRAILAYALITAAALYTEYYVALLPLAHFLWAIWQDRRRPRALLPLLAADLLTALLYLPWVIFTIPHLISYIQAKVVADNDAPLGLLAYVGRHLIAFGGGHVPLAELDWLRYAGMAGLFLAAGLAILSRKRDADRATTLLLAWGLILPVAIGYAFNRLWPFFPDGGERVLFFLLPSIVLLVALIFEKTWDGDRLMRFGAWGTLFLLLIGAGSGITAFYTVPRYADDDYRPLIRQVVQQGTDADVVMAVFPWQVGFWRAYAPAELGPLPHLLSFNAVAWGTNVADALDQGLAAGTVWLPSLLSIGSTLPQEMEAYLAPRALNVENRWISPTTRLSAWSRLQPATPQPLTTELAPLRLISAALMPSQLPSANAPLQIDLNWEPSAQLSEFQATLRLVDTTGHTWAERTLPALDTLSPGSGQDRLGILIPAGLPPGDYTVQIGVMPGTADVESLAFVDLGRVRITPPTQPVDALRLPIQHPLAAPVPHGALLLLGYTGPTLLQPVLAGTALDVTLFWQGRPQTDVNGEEPVQAFYVALLDDSGVVGSWEGTSIWPQGPSGVGTGELAQVPAAVQLSGYAVTGTYDLVAGLVQTDGSRTGSTHLGRVAVVRRVADFSPPVSIPAHRLNPPMRFGTHALLLGYDLTAHPADPLDGEIVLDLTLYWRVEQALLPPHQLFVHVEDADGLSLAQADATPNSRGTLAPSGSWQSDEYLTHQPVSYTHLTLPTSDLV